VRPPIRRLVFAAALVALVGPAADPKTDGKNLIPNGDFEQGTHTPAHW
jgi:hypothetical protein